MQPYVNFYIDNEQGLEVSGFKSFNCSESVYGHSFFTLSFRSSNISFWDKLYSLKKKHVFELDWGFFEGDAVTVLGERRKVLVSVSSFDYWRGSVDIEIVGTDLGRLLKERCYSHIFYDEKISDIVKSVCANYSKDLKCRVTDTDGKVSAYSCKRNDADFISESCLPSALSGEKRTDYNFYIENGQTIVFEPPKLTGGTTLSFSLDDPLDSGISSIKSHYRRQDVVDGGGYVTETRGYDTARKVPLFYVSSSDDMYGKRFLDTGKKDSQDMIVKTTGSTSTQPEIIPSEINIFSSRDEKYPLRSLENYSNGRWSRNARSLYRVEVEYRPIFNLDVADTVNLDVENAGGESASLSGKYLVYGRNTIVEIDGLRQIAYLERRGHV